VVDQPIDCLVLAVSRSFKIIVSLIEINVRQSNTTVSFFNLSQELLSFRVVLLKFSFLHARHVSHLLFRR
jgi:hypothetical protein